MKSAVIFPGQGSQYVGMDQAGGGPLAPDILAEADDVLGFSLSTLLKEGPEARLAETAITQPAILTVSVALMASIRRRFPEFQPVAAAGHSLGEYSALVTAGALNFADALRLVRLRGEAMQRAVPPGEGAMAAVMGLDGPTLEKLCVEQAQGEVLSVSAWNGPAQIVVAGHSTAVDRLVEAAEALRGVAKKLAVSAPFHCALMAPAAQELAEALAAIEIRMPTWPIVHNADAAVADNPEGIRHRLIAQVISPVRWESCVKILKEMGAERCIEVGPNKTLAGLNKRIDRSFPTLSLDTPGTWEKI
jgi:[acyl-carrier-protein] S-malonyltransferase